MVWGQTHGASRHAAGTSRLCGPSEGLDMVILVVGAGKRRRSGPGPEACE